MRRWKVAGAPNKPNGSVTNWCNPNGRVKAVFSLDKKGGQGIAGESMWRGSGLWPPPPLAGG